MKKTISLVAILALVPFIVPAMAGDTSSMGEGQSTFYALSKLPTAESTALTQMTDDQLVAIEGADNICVVCANANVQAQILTDKSTQQTGNQTNQR
jgi:hypothetical protein